MKCINGGLNSRLCKEQSFKLLLGLAVTSLCLTGFKILSQSRCFVLSKPCESKKCVKNDTLYVKIDKLYTVFV